jgi:hypothetical protein
VIDLDPQDQRLCAICAHPLVLFEPASRRLPSAWAHGLADQLEDHSAVPVRAAELHQIRAVCDFCNAGCPQWIVPVRSFDESSVLSIATAGRSVAAWSACAQCKILLERSQWSALRDRVLGPFANDFARHAVGKLHRLLRGNITAPPATVPRSTIYFGRSHVDEHEHRRGRLDPYG